MGARSLADTTMLPLLDRLGQLLPKLLLPYAETMTKSLDMWKSVAIAETAERANEELLKPLPGLRLLLEVCAELCGTYSTYRI